MSLEGKVLGGKYKRNIITDVEGEENAIKKSRARKDARKSFQYWNNWYKHIYSEYLQKKYEAMKTSDDSIWTRIKIAIKFFLEPVYPACPYCLSKLRVVSKEHNGLEMSPDFVCYNCRKIFPIEKDLDTGKLLGGINKEVKK